MKKNDIIIKRNVPNMNKTYHKIVAGFPGVGKSTAAYMQPDKYVDMESSYYHWIYDEVNSTKECAPNWPNNYVDAIIHAATTTTYPQCQNMIICISTHKEVLAELAARGIAFDAVCPRTKDIYIQRYINRGNNEAFVKLLKNKFKEFVQDLTDSNAETIYFTDGYFADIFNAAYIYHNINGKRFPITYCNKIIIAVWPVDMAAEIDISRVASLIVIDTRIQCNANPLIHHVRTSLIRYMLDDGIEQMDREDKEKDLFDAYYEYAKTLASTEEYPDTKYIAVGAYPEIMDKLRADDMNYVLVVPNSHKKFLEYCSPEEKTMTEEEFMAARKKLMDDSFHTMVTDQFIPLCFTDNDVCQNINSREFVESVKNSTEEQ